MGETYKYLFDCYTLFWMDNEFFTKAYNEAVSIHFPQHAKLSEKEMRQLLDSFGPTNTNHLPRECYSCQTQEQATDFLSCSIKTNSSPNLVGVMDAQDVALVASQARTTKEVAARALKEAGSDLVEAIMLIRDGKVK